MPVYEYRCDACWHECERLQRITAEPLRLCPMCDAEALGRLISATSFRLVGGGWFAPSSSGGPRGEQEGDCGE